MVLNQVRYGAFGRWKTFAKVANVKLCSKKLWHFQFYFSGGALLLITSGLPFALLGLSIFTLLAIKDWLKSKRCSSQARLNGKWVVITDATDGMEYETALQLSMKGANLIIGSRNVTEKVKKMAQNMTFKTGNTVKSKFYLERTKTYFFLPIY